MERRNRRVWWDGATEHAIEIWSQNDVEVGHAPYPHDSSENGLTGAGVVAGVLGVLSVVGVGVGGALAIDRSRAVVGASEGPGQHCLGARVPGGRGPDPRPEDVSLIN